MLEEELKIELEEIQVLEEEQKEEWKKVPELKIGMKAKQEPEAANELGNALVDVQLIEGMLYKMKEMHKPGELLKRTH